MRNDHPTLEDKLNRVSLVTSKAERIMQCEPPLTFGVHGDWGAGKTSFLRQLRFYLDNTKDSCAGRPSAALRGGAYEDRVVTIWFEAWRYQHESAPIVALLQEIRRQFSGWAKARQKVEKLLEVSVGSVLNSIDDVAKLLKLEAVPLNPKGIQKEGERWEKEHLESRLGVDNVQKFLEDAVGTVLNSLVGDRGRVVVFIDDLDRCSAEAAFRLLEGLKIYLGLKNCVFVIGMNQQLVVDAISICMPKEMLSDSSKAREAAARIRAEAYLEKLCTDIERLTPPSDAASLLGEWIDDSSLKTLVERALKTGDSPVRCLPPNPRRLKALANLLGRWWPRLGGVADDAVLKVRALIIISYVYQFHSELFQRWQFNPAFYTHMSSWAAKVWSPSVDWPAYFAGLKLPEEVYNDASPQEATPRVAARSTFPDPYAADVFWIAPLIRESNLNEDLMARVMRALTHPEVI